MRINRMLGIGALSAVLGAAACVAPRETSNIAPTTPIAVAIRNQNFLDVNVFAISGSMSHRLGTVMGNGVANFSLNPAYAMPDLRIVAVPIGGRGRVSSDRILASPGDSLQFDIPARMGF